jgi:hypothetical protein
MRPGSRPGRHHQFVEPPGASSQSGLRLGAPNRVEQLEKRTGTWPHPILGRRVTGRGVPPRRRRPVRRRHPTRWRNPARRRVSVVPPRTPLGVIPVAMAPPILMEANPCADVGAGGRGDGGEHHRSRHACARRRQYECATPCRLAHILFPSYRSGCNALRCRATDSEGTRVR